MTWTQQETETVNQNKAAANPVRCPFCRKIICGFTCKSVYRPKRADGTYKQGDEKLYEPVIFATCTCGMRGPTVEGWNHKAALEAVARQEKWQPIETAPETGGFLGWCKLKCTMRNKLDSESEPSTWITDWKARHIWRKGSAGGFAHGGDDLAAVEVIKATHWQPLPDAPTGFKEEKS